ncbi:MAG: hypothetical protein IKE57_03745 [Oscillospiraceae bacterium]|nr:hypothetical protein [Oscillospiraceae bacterium]
MKIGIGIDTGGTCTDAVAVDLETKKLLAKGKTLTTREDLAIGIGKALDMLPQELIREAALVSLSTTLATNACIEGKGCRAKLVLFGLNDEYLDRLGAREKYSLKRDAVLCVDTHSSADGLQVDEPDWEALFAEHRDWLSDADALSAVELYADYSGAPNEKRFRELAGERTDAKCVVASELTSGVNVLARGATALLNARLFPIVREFVEAAEADFRRRGCTAPVMVVRSDGSLMATDLTLSRPVDTILSGPAASVLAGKGFSDSENYIIVDMGGTSTDVSVVKARKPVTAPEGIRIAGWLTSVRGIMVSPYNLGGDSAIRLVDWTPRLFPRRVRSFCSAAVQWPEIKGKLRQLLREKRYNQFPLQEFFYLVREPENLDHYDEAERRLIDHVRSGPRLLAHLKTEAGIDIYHLNSERLEEEGVIMRIGMTPTDFMHIRGDYLEYDREASVLAARYMLQSMGRAETEEELQRFAEEAYALVEGQIFENLMRIALERQYPAQFGDGLDGQTEFLIRRAWQERDAAGVRLLRSAFATDYTLIGIGAPTHLFLPKVAELMGAECLLPENAEVANAIGALAADLNVEVRVAISQRYDPGRDMTLFIVHAPTGSSSTFNRNEALAYARSQAEEAALAEARRRGAAGEVRVTSRLERQTTAAENGQTLDVGLAVVGEAEVRSS